MGKSYSEMIARGLEIFKTLPPPIVSNAADKLNRTSEKVYSLYYKEIELERNPTEENFESAARSWAEYYAIATAEID